MFENKKEGLSNLSIVGLIVLILVGAVVITYSAQYFFADKEIEVQSTTLTEKKTEYEISKLDADISRIRSETSGSLFWLKLIALFVTVGGAIGGYLLGQSRMTLAKLNFEDRKNVDEVYQSIIKELADDAPILRAAAAVKLGAILNSFPVEWNVSQARKEQMTELTKQVLSAALSIEKDEKVLKTLTINLVLHKSCKDDLYMAKYLDLSGAQGHDAYWARCDFEYTDFYAANLTRTSFRKSKLRGTQFRETLLENTVFDNADCSGTNFKMADLRGASFKEANLEHVNFENAKMYSVNLSGATLHNCQDCEIDVSETGDGSRMILLSEFLHEQNIFQESSLMSA